MSTPLESKFSLAEPIPGYLVRERIGAGGYGEVFRADAPGGIAKAIKVVYGFRNDERANRELTSLNRIKEVRHPFLLSLERIEVVDGHLVIVAELATSSLKQQFDDHRQAGRPGIPRIELLGYLQDAADALDYISQEHSLQHLDVKPENLLLVGGRIKVADFGLVKDLQDVNSSMVGGMTPVYAAPEIFDGRPNLHSDQYSLAIVFQEMLTGTLPYEGRTTAQLAAQHIHSRPRLERLPASDQAPIAKALEKNPEQRFASCRDLIDSLWDATPNQRARAPRVAVRPAASRAAAAPSAPSAPMATEVISAGPVQPWPEDTRPAMATQVTETPQPVRNLPPLDYKAAEAEYRPTVFLGVGGVASATLRALHGRLCDRFGDLHGMEAVQLLALETDPESLRAVTLGEEDASLADDSAMLLPLRQPADYRRESSNRLQWLSRRWIYNIPRSSQTQSFRPLGRLALVDHMERVIERITRAIRTAIDPAKVAATAEKTGLPFRDGAPRIFILSSISSGSGSGMVLDLGYIVRNILRDLGLPEEGLCGILAHCAGGNPQARELAVANAYSFLIELHHYSDLHHAYPGDPVCGLPAFGPDDAPFNHTYVVNLGEDLEQDDFAAGTQRLATFLYYNTVAASGTLFDRCRPAAADGSTASVCPAVRTFALTQLGFAAADIPPQTIAELGAALLAKWKGVERDTSDDQSASLADPTSLLATQFASGLSQADLRQQAVARAESLGLKAETILERLYTKATHEMGDDADSYLQAVLGELLKSYDSGRMFSHNRPPNHVVIDTLDAIIRHDDKDGTHKVCLESVLDAYMQELSESQGDSLRGWVLELVNSPLHRIAGAQRMTDFLGDYLRNVSHQAAEAVQTTLKEVCALKAALLADKKGSSNWLKFRGFGAGRRLVADQRLSHYFQLKIRELTLNAVCRLTGQVLGQMAQVGDKLRNLAADMNRVAGELTRTAPSLHTGKSPAAGRAESAARLIAATVSEYKTDLVAVMENELESALHQVATTAISDVPRMLLPLLRRKARHAVLEVLKQVTQREVAANCHKEPPDPLFSIASALKAAITGLADCGGAQRALLIVPEAMPVGPLVEQIHHASGLTPTVVAAPENDVIYCTEVEQIALRRVAAAILAQRFQSVEVASRLHTRVDVPWSPL